MGEMNKEITDIQEVGAGTWCTFCCDADLQQIETIEDLVEILKSQITDLEDGDFDGYRFWRTKEDALSDLLAQPKS